MDRNTLREDTPCQKVGRVLIVLSGNLLLLFLGIAVGEAEEPAGTQAWGRAVLSATFDLNRIGKVAWPLLAVFILGNVLNIFGLWPQIKRSRYSIRGLMLSVVIVAVACACVRYRPLVGFVLIPMACLSPGVMIKLARPPRPVAEPCGELSQSVREDTTPIRPY